MHGRSGLFPYLCIALKVRACLALVSVCVCVCIAGAATADPVPSERAPTRPLIQSAGEFWMALQSAQAQAVHDIDLTFVVGYCDPWWHLLWAQLENDEVVFFQVDAGRWSLEAGQRVRLVGEVVPAKGLELARVRLEVLADRDQRRVTARDSDVAAMEAGQCAVLEIEGVVDWQGEIDSSHQLMEVLVANRLLTVRVLGAPDEPIVDFAEQRVRLRGLCVAEQDAELGSVSLQMWVGGVQDVVPLGLDLTMRARFERPATEIESFDEHTEGEWVRVVGVLQEQEPRRRLTIRDDTGQIDVFSPLSRAMPVGSIVQAVGRLERTGPFGRVVDAVYRQGQGDSLPPEASGRPIYRVIEQVVRMSPDEADKHYPVRVTGVVTFSRPKYPVMFVQDASAGICVVYDEPPTGLIAHAASVMVEGVSEKGDFAPLIRATRVHVRGVAPMPEARLVSLEQVLTGVEDAQWIEMQGYLRTIVMDDGFAKLQLTSSAGDFVVRVPAQGPLNIHPGSIVHARGVCATKANAKRQLESILLNVTSAEYLRVAFEAPSDPFELPIVPVVSLSQYQPAADLNRQVRVEGSVVHHVPGRYLLLRDGDDYLWAQCAQRDPLAPGDVVDVVGVPGRRVGRVVLREGLYRRVGKGEVPPAQDLGRSIVWNPAMDGSLVRVVGTLVDASAHQDETRLYVQVGEAVCDVVLERAVSPRTLSRWVPRSEIEVHGVYQLEPFARLDGTATRANRFHLLLRSEDDVVVLATPSWWTAKRVGGVAGACGGLGILGLAWGVTLRRRVSRQTAVIRAQIEKEADLEAQNRDIINSASDFIFAVDLEGRFVSFNPAGEKLTGYSRAEAATMTLYDLVGSHQARLLRRTFDNPGDRDEMETFEIRFRRRDETWIWIEINARFAREGDRAVGVLGVARDISARKQIETELRRARDAAEAATQAKSVFLANMSHEIRTPMNGVIGMSNLLLDTALNREQRDFAVTIRDSAEALLTVLNDILDFSKIEAGKLHFESIDFDLHETVEATLDVVASRAAAKHLELAAFIEHDVPHAVRGDPSRLRQVLLNLVGNAIKFTEAGEVTLSVRCQPLESPDKFVLRFEVADTGIGLSDEQCRQLFQPFVQADSSMTRRFGGTGLGLAISRQIVHLMEGRIGVESELGKGATFWFAVPLQSAHDPGAISAVAMPSLEGLRVLSVDDVAVNRRLVAHYLARTGARLDHAACGCEAMDTIRAAAAGGDPYQLVLLDCNMPDCDGLAVAQMVHDDPVLQTTRMVLLTSLDRRGTAEDLASIGIVGSLVKPIRKAELFQTIARALMGGGVRPTSSAEGGGAIDQADAARPAAGRATQPSSAVVPGAVGVRVLVAEDNIVNQRLALLQLKKLGCGEVTVVGNGLEALEALARAPYDLIFMDCQMPELDGFETTQRLREDFRYRGLRIVAMTANAMEGDRERCLAVGMDDYLSKPIRVNELRDALARSIEAVRGSTGR